MATAIMLFIAISVLILVHELGHFYSAIWLKVKVEEFGFGFPPRIFSKVKNGIRYSINALPFGGFVKIFGEQGEGERSPESFASRPARHRFAILAAGVGMNFVLAWVLFSIGAWVGTPQVDDESSSSLPVSIITILPNSPAEDRGLRFGDQILEMRGTDISLRVEQEKDVSDFVDGFRGEEIVMVIKRGGDIKEITITPRARVPDGEGPLGISMGRLTTSRVAWYAAPLVGAKILVQTFMAIVGGLWTVVMQLIWHGRTATAVSGPVGIYFFGRDVQALGLSYVLQFVGMLSVNLGILNALPIPALDGGRMFFVLIEKIRGVRMNPIIEARAHTIGFALLILLMAVVTYRDIANIFS
ncbi:MAG: M50 family metallopeptidase [Patescibacteria group bacterium]